MPNSPLARPIDDDGALTPEVARAIADSPYSSHDLAPVPPSERRWGVRDLAVLWVSMSACVTTYTLASGLIDQGMDWKQSVITIFLGNCIVLVPMILNAHAGTKYGISFPVYCRASFGLRGANFPALVRALVACGWFGIQTWYGGEALHAVVGAYDDTLDRSPMVAALGITRAQLTCFLIFWSVNMLVIWRGVETIRLLLNVKAPLLIGLGLALLAWAYEQAGGFGPMLSRPSAFGAGGAREGQFWAAFFPALTANVGYWATLSLNIPDFTRYARSQRDQVLGQALGLPTTMGLYAFIGVAVTSATVVIYGREIWDPVKLLEMFENRVVLVLAMASLALATLATNIAANVVSPANDFANLAPRFISFRTGGMITGLIGILIRPWHLVSDPARYIGTWLVGSSSLLGAVGGILITDYYLIRRTQLDLAGLYRRGGPYWYREGFNLTAVAALAAGIAPCLPGLIEKFLLLDAPIGSPAAERTFWTALFDYAWFVSFGVSALVYYVGAKLTRIGEPTASPE
jgi:NCS1 family nucleobase:cation symporter-1